MDSIGAVSPALNTSVSSPVTERSRNAAPVAQENDSTAEPPKKKQKRNKPTLSCEECVERKTKVSAL
jgi:hypothetical protein